MGVHVANTFIGSFKIISDGLTGVSPESGSTPSPMYK
ncbi:hypothetical protein JGX30_13530 [Listeria monocytogenes]|nr:hypothetical protein [Listeria monocytogenes]